MGARRSSRVDVAVGVRRLVGVRFAGVLGEGGIGVGSGTRNGVLDSCEASVSYTLWRNPDDPDDPVNLGELDEQQRRALEAAPAWPRPATARGVGPADALPDALGVRALPCSESRYVPEAMWAARV
jgi:hypothetical protein